MNKQKFTKRQKVSLEINKNYIDNLSKEELEKVMVEFDNSTVHNVKNLNDGRVLFRTHNGFKYWLKTAKEILEITEEYYNKVFRK